MKTSKILVLLLICSFTGIFEAQSIADNIKESNCDFEIVYKTDETEFKLNVVKQMITKRGVFFKDERGAGGYQEYFLEFVYDNNINLEDFPLMIAKFYSKEGNHIATIDINVTSYFGYHSHAKRSIFLNKAGSKSYYAFCLESIPLIMLDDVKKIVLMED